MKPRALDLFCGAGGATRGLQRAGFHVTGIDIKPQPKYCGDLFIQADALNPPIDLSGFDFIWASPPCQAFTMAQRIMRRSHPDYVGRTRRMLTEADVAWCIENVPGAPLIRPVELCGAVPTRDGASLWFQVPVGKYTADFLLTIAQENGGYATSAIECDGHDFHNVTKTQASHDRARDREFQQRGLLILRYTGSDIWRSPLKCAVDAITITKDRSRQSTAKRWAE